MHLTCSAPGKLMLLGEHSVVYGHPCLVTAVNQRIYVTVKTITTPKIILNSPDLKIKNYQKEIKQLGQGELAKEVKFVEILIKNFREKFGLTTGLEINTHNDFSTQFGFGSSSAVTVALALALAKLFEIRLSKKQLFTLCYQTILEIQGVGSGFDLAAAIWGGTIYYVMPAKIVKKIPVKNLPILVGYTGIKADTATIVKDLAKRMEENPDLKNNFSKISQLVERAKLALSNRDFASLGELMTANHQLLKNLGVSSKELENLTQASLSAGALGAKLSGAGGGDCMLAVYDKKDQSKSIEQAITQVGGQIMLVKLNAPGAKIENAQNNF